MSMPNIPNITPSVNLDIRDSIKMVLDSLALHEMGLSHIVNAEGEKLQYILGTLNNTDCLEGSGLCNDYIDSDKLLQVNQSIKSTLREVLRSQIILQMKMEDTMVLYDKICDDKIFYNDCMNINQTDGCKRTIECEDGINCEPIYF